MNRTAVKRRCMVQNLVFCNQNGIRFFFLLPMLLKFAIAIASIFSCVLRTLSDPWSGEGTKCKHLSVYHFSKHSTVIYINKYAFWIELRALFLNGDRTFAYPLVPYATALETLVRLHSWNQIIQMFCTHWDERKKMCCQTTVKQCIRGPPTVFSALANVYTEYFTSTHPKETYCRMNF